MKADISTLSALFQKDVRYLIPTFQRPYVWTQDDQWEPLWNDVRGTAERYIEEQQRAGPDNEATAHDRTPAHFLGAIVIQQQSFPPHEIERRLVIDGQQRLTTLQLLLDATQEVFEELDLAPYRQLRRLVLNDEVMLNGQPDNAFKVWPTLMDQDAFRHAMHNELPSDEYKESNIVEAHDFFKLQVREWIEDSRMPPEQCALALQAAITRLLHLVVIDLSMDDDPHIIFETLNARGTALLQADLVKNFILHEAGKDADALYEGHLSKLETEWWREDVAQGRLIRPRVDVFLNYWIVMRQADEVQATNVFQTVREYAKDAKGQSVADVAADIGNIARVYREIQGTADDPVLNAFLYRWRVMQVGVLTPVLMWLRAADLSGPTLERSLRTIESYLVRRMVCRMSTTGYANMSYALLKRLNDADGEEADTVIEAFLAEQTAEANLWPDDRRLEDAFRSLPLYRLLTRGRMRLVLEGIEEQLLAPLAENTRVPKNLTIEHFMPQGWRAHWAPPPETDVPGEAKSQRDRLLHSIGNLTLVTQRLNSTLKNAPWDEKRETLNTYSVLRLKESLVNEGKWNEDTIKDRSRYLAKVAAEVWPHADRI